MGNLKYNFRIAFRNLQANRKFTVINIIGLALGLTVSLLIFIYIHYENSFDSFNKNADNIYRIVEKNIQDGEVGASTPLALSDVLKDDYPEIDKVIGLIRTYKDIEVDNNKFREAKGAIVEKEFFDLFNFPINVGNSETIFNDPFDAVITKTFAGKLFGTSEVLGNTFQYEENTFTVVGIVDDLPTNSIFRFDYFLSDKYRYKTYPDLHERWYNFGLYTFVTFKGDNLPPGFEQKLSEIEDKYYPDFMKDRHNYQVIKFKGSHLNSTLAADMVSPVTPVYLLILGIIAFAILLIACLNFMNISISILQKRMVTVGIKKVNGATQRGLIGNLFSEISIAVVISLTISLVGIFILLPLFNSLLGKNIELNLLDPFLWVAIFSFGLITIIISGFYPSILVSKAESITALLANKTKKRNNVSFQKSFVVLQFSIVIILCVSQFLIFKQISFMQNHDSGFDKENLIAIPVRSLGNNGSERVKNANLFIETIDRFQSQYAYGKACISEFIPGFNFNNRFNIFPENTSSKNGIELLSCDIDENFIDVFGLKVLHGRKFSKEHATESNAIIINESAFKKLGWETIEGKTVDLFSKGNTKHVVGVVNNINIKSIKHSIEPMFYQFGRHHNYPGYISVRVNSVTKSEALDFFKTKWVSLFPDVPFEFESIEEKFQLSYGEEEKQAKITGIFSILAIFISFLGLFALSALESENRTKEIGIRKVNGAKISEILTLLNKDFIKWVAIAFVIACPIAYYAMNKWLENFAYKTSLSWWIFALAGVLALGIALLTVSWQSYKAATRNPIESLRYE
jgi:putative ABC transport system permease protein